MSTNFVSGESRNVELVVTASATAGTPVKVGSLLGTMVDAADSANKAIVNVHPTATFKHSVRNVLTYAGGVESTFAAATEGRDVYYDASSTMPAGIFLSFSPLDKDDAANKKFGKVVGGLDAAVIAKTMTNVEVIQDKN